MSLRDVQARTAARNAAGANQVYPQHAGGGSAAAVPPVKPLPVIRDACQHRSPEPVGSVKCPTCRGHVEVKVFACAVHGSCSVAKKADGVPGVCATCTDHTAISPAKS